MRFRIPPPPHLPRAVNVALAIALPLTAFAVECALRSWIEHIPFVLFFLAVTLAASIGGWGPGFVATATAAVCGYSFLATSSNADRVAGALLGSALFVPVASLMTGIASVVREGFTERERAARDLEHSVALRDQFISTASHELNTPITSLSLIVQQMRRTRVGDRIPDAERRLDTLQRQTDRLSQLVRELLDVSRLGAGRMPLHLDPVDLSEVVRDVTARFEEDARSAGSTVGVEAPPGVVGRWDRARVEHIVSNLLSNAVKYGGGQPISVSVSARGDDALIVVKDEGLGIAAQDHDRIFERFERGEHGSAYGGFGLGLWVVRESVAAMNGSVRVESAPRHGATFTVTLPRATAASSASSNASR